MLRALALLGLFTSYACGNTPPMPKGPPPEYEEHDAGTPIFEGDAPKAAAPAPEKR